MFQNLRDFGNVYKSLPLWDENRGSRACLEKITMVGQDTAKERKQVKPTSDLEGTVVPLVTKFNGEPRESHYVVGKGVFDSPEHCAEVCGPEPLPNLDAMGYTREVLGGICSFDNYSAPDRKNWL